MVTQNDYLSHFVAEAMRSQTKRNITDHNYYPDVWLLALKPRQSFDSFITVVSFCTQVSLQSMLTGSAANSFADDIMKWQKRLQTIEAVLSVWLEVQDKWIELEDVSIIRVL